MLQRWLRTPGHPLRASRSSPARRPCIAAGAPAAAEALADGAWDDVRTVRRCAEGRPAGLAWPARLPWRTGVQRVRVQRDQSMTNPQTEKGISS